MRMDGWGLGRVHAAGGVKFAFGGRVLDLADDLNGSKPSDAIALISFIGQPSINNVPSTFAYLLINSFRQD